MNDHVYSHTMKAMLWTRYGPPEAFELADIERPEPGPGELLIRNRASTVTAGDGEIRRMDLAPYFALPLRFYFGIFRPRRRVLGQELAGVVEDVGPGVTRFKVGDEILALPGFKFGAYAQYCVLPEDAEDVVLTPKPAKWDFTNATTLPFGGVEALQFLEKADIQTGQTVLINGAGGSIGTYAIQIAKHLGAEITAVDSQEKLAMLEKIGSAHTIDYRQQDYTRLGQQFDVIFDVVGSARFTDALRALRPGGFLLNANPKLGFMLRAAIARARGLRTYFSASESKAPFLPKVVRLAEDGVLEAVIDRRYPLEELAAAHRYVDSGAKAGHVVIEID